MNADEFKQKVIPLSGKLFYLARLLLNNSAEAEDSVQEIFLKLWNLRNNLEEYNNLEAFAMKVTRNWCLDRLKARKPVYIDNYTGGYNRHSDRENPLKLLEQADQLQTVRLIIRELPEQQQTVIQLRDVEGFEYEEIAEIMEMNINAVRVTLSRARNKIREYMVKLDNYGNPAHKNSARQI
jgi:RNA polymerase sigma factor (sigma-70 family)